MPALTVWLVDGDARNRARAARFLGLLGSDAGAALPVLGRMAEQEQDGPARVAALGALMRLGDAAWPALVRAARKTDPTLIHALPAPTRARYQSMLDPMG